MMDEFQIELDVERPVEDVFAALVNLGRIPDWNLSVINVECANDASLGVGSRVVYIGKFLGRTYKSEAEVTEFVPSTRYSSKTVSGPFQLEISNTLKSLGDVTRITSDFRGESQGFFKLAEPVMVRVTKNLFETSMDNFKALLLADAL
ncbi:MAG: SRPBCC family protein [Acidimicrobiales bacterium]